MKVLLVSPNREHLPDPVFPLGLSYIAASLVKNNHDVRALDLCFSKDIENDIKNCLDNFSPKLIGVSLRNIDDVAYPKKHSFAQEYKNVISILRKRSDALIVLGGSGFTIMPEHFMELLGADYGVVGEGENAVNQLISEIKKKKSGKVKKIFSARLKSLDDILPGRSFIDSRAYYRYGGMLNIQTKRGCGFKCIYCTYPNIEGRKVRMRSPKKVVDELECVVSDTGIKHFFIVDSVFNYPASHAFEICKEIIDRKLDVKWSCHCNPVGMTEELVKLMVHSGCTGVEFGLDSLNDEGLRILNKAFDFEKIKEASNLCRNNGLKFCHYIFVGAPGDTMEKVKQTIERLDEINPDAAVIMAGIRVFPETKIAALAKNHLGIKEIGLEPVFYITPEVLNNMESIVDEISKRKNWSMPGFEINIYERLQKKLREYGAKGALWEGLALRDPQRKTRCK
jgi:radical SAM superfamily enzyme YgiQ (UPF0313 family)